MSDPIDHHYLPVFFLKQWARQDGKVIRYHRPHGPVVAHPISPRSTGYEPRLYSLTECPPGRSQLIERDFMAPAVDSPAAEVLQLLLARRTLELSNDAKCSWARFLMSLLLRNPEKIAELQRKGRKQIEESLTMNPHEYEALRGPNDPATLLEWTETQANYLLENAGKLSLPSLIDNPKIGNEIINFKWFTSEFSQSQFSLLASDRPLVMTTGLQRAGCVIALPLGPRLAFFAARDRSLIEHVVQRRSSTELARALNGSVVSQAYRHVYGIDSSQLRFVERNLQKVAPIGPI